MIVLLIGKGYKIYMSKHTRGTSTDAVVTCTLGQSSIGATDRMLLWVPPATKHISTSVQVYW